MTEKTHDESKAVCFGYTNWRGETSIRRAVPIAISWGSTDWHPEPGWLMTAYDLERQAERQFALTDCDFTKTD